MIDRWDSEIDVRGLLCPLPVLKAGKQLRKLEQGHIVKVIATDPMSAIDLPHFCQEQGHHLLSHQQQDGTYIFLIQCG